MIFLSWRPPDVTHQNGIIEGYCVEFAEVNASTQFEYTTQEPYLFIYDLEPGVNYTCRIAAFTVEIGPFSEAITIMQEIDIDTDSGKHSGIVPMIVSSPLIAVLFYRSGYFGASVGIVIWSPFHSIVHISADSCVSLLFTSETSERKQVVTKHSI